MKGSRSAHAALVGLALASRYEGDLAAAKSHYQESITLCRQVGDKVGLARALSGFSQLQQDQGDLAGAKKTVREAITIERTQGAKRALSVSLERLGLIEMAEDDLAAAKATQSEGLSLRLEIGDKSLAVKPFGAGALEFGGRPSRCHMLVLAQQAAAVCREEKAIHLETSAEAIAALSQAMRSRSASSAPPTTAALLPRVESGSCVWRQQPIGAHKP